MKMSLDCIPCFMRQSLEAARIATTDGKLQEQALRKVAKLMQGISFESSPPEIANQAHRIVRDATGNPDPYKELKKRDNELALRLYPELKRIIERSGDRLHFSQLFMAETISSKCMPPSPFPYRQFAFCTPALNRFAFPERQAAPAIEPAARRLTVACGATIVANPRLL